VSELRWILLAAGVALIVGLYVWGMRARRRSATPDLDGSHRVESVPAPALSKSLSEPVRREPRLSLDDDDVAIAVPETVDPVEGAEPALDHPETRAAAPARAVASNARTEPTISSVPETEGPAASEPAAAPDGAADRQPRKAQKIVAVRVAAPMPKRFEGQRLKEALDRNGLRHGRFDIFHRLAPDGRPIISLASVLEPGTFDPAAMDKAAYPGVALFTVLPGPVSALDALEDLLVTSRALASQLGGTVLDEKGAPLSLQRIAHMRDDVVAFERNARSTEATG
jgi:cell division protein ZipA